MSAGGICAMMTGSVVAVSFLHTADADFCRGAGGSGFVSGTGSGFGSGTGLAVTGSGTGFAVTGSGTGFAVTVRLLVLVRVFWFRVQGLAR